MPIRDDYLLRFIEQFAAAIARALSPADLPDLEQAAARTGLQLDLAERMAPTTLLSLLGTGGAAAEHALVLGLALAARARHAASTSDASAARSSAHRARALIEAATRDRKDLLSPAVEAVLDSLPAQGSGT